MLNIPRFELKLAKDTLNLHLVKRIEAKTRRFPEEQLNL